MDLYDKLRKNPFVFKRLTGISIQEFQTIRQKLGPVWNRKHEAKKKIAGRPYGIGNLENQLLCLLIYYRTYTTQLFIGLWYQVDDATVCRAIKRLEPILAKVVAIKKDRTLAQGQVEELLIDCTEQPIQRPTKKQKAYYSGKKKRHTLKTEIVMTEQGRIVNLSNPHAGKLHDIGVRRSSTALPPGSRVYADSGYQGLQKEHKKTEIPIKKPKGKELTKEEKEWNRLLASYRIAIEHKIGALKVFQILAQTYRNYRKGYSLKMNIIAGIVNIKNGF